MKKHHLMISIIGVVCFIVLIGCSATPATQETTDQKSPIVIGASLPLTGQRQGPGNAAKQGYEVWAAMVNAAGGLLGRQIELKIVDNASNPDTAAADYEKLISVDKVDLVVGTFSSVLVIPTSEVAAKHGYAYVEPAGGAPDVFNRGLTNIFFAQPAPGARQADPFALYILNLPADQRPKTFAVVSLDDPFTLGVMNRLKGLLTDGGLNSVLDTKYPADKSDFSDIAAQVAKLNPDLILGGTQEEDSRAQILAYQAAGYQPHIAYFTNGPTVPVTFQKALGKTTEGIFSSISWFPEGKDYQNTEFTANYIKLSGGSLSDIPEDAANAFTVGQILQQAIEKIGLIDNTALVKELHQGTYKTIVGQLGFDETGAPNGSFMLLQWQGGKFVIVGPKDRAEADPLPVPKPNW